MLKRLSILLLVLAVVAVALYGGERYLQGVYAAPGPASHAVRIQVDGGMSARTVLTRAAHLGVLRHPRLTELYLRLTGRRFSIKAGEYEIPPAASPAQIVTLLAEGRVVLEQLTIVEGSTFADFRHALEAHPKVHSTLRGVADAQVMTALGRSGAPPEGEFFPDTYRFAAGTSDVEILKLAYDKMQQLLAEAWAQRLPDLPLHTAYEALILASIVEKETGVPDERPRIAGVFETRLRKGMRLQSDPTVIYGLGAQYDGMIHTRDLTTDTVYNTYTRLGLPPTPIALPGRAAILATTRPEESGALYFVATGDGGHHFSATLEEHNAAVQHYLQRLRQQAVQAAPVSSAPTARAATAGGASQKPATR
jgi:UPF0755 protein